jgi:hypothetical protein
MVAKDNKTAEVFAELDRGVHAALETYSNVHRGSGQNSLVSTYLFEQARKIVLEHLGLDEEKYAVIFSTPRRAEALKSRGCSRVSIHGGRSRGGSTSSGHPGDLRAV